VACGIDREHSRGFAKRELMTDKSKSARRLIDGKDCDAVVATIGSVQEPSAWMDGDFRGGVWAVEYVGQGGDRLEFREGPTL